MDRNTDTDTIKAGRRTVPLHRPDKVLFPDLGLTKADLAEYYLAAAPRLLPQLRDRPLMLERHPDGVGGSRFMQKAVPTGAPDWVSGAEVPKEGGTLNQVLCQDAPTLVYLVDQACITPHRWLSRADQPRRPDLLVFDLDPADPEDGGAADEKTSFGTVRAAAHQLADLLSELGLRSVPMTTGSRGLHILVPLRRGPDADEVLEFATGVATVLTGLHPEELTIEARKQARGDRLYLDVHRNGYAQTAVAPYAVRALPGAPVAAPLAWDEVDDPALTGRRWTVADMPQRLKDDPWEGLLTHQQSLERAREALLDR